MIVIKVLLVIVFAAGGVLLAVSNPGSTEVNFLVGRAEIPTIWLVVGSLTVGALLGAAFSGVAVVRWRHRARQWRQKAERAEQEPGHLRNLPYQGA